VSVAEKATRELTCFVCGKVADETKIDPATYRCRKYCFHRMKMGSPQSNPRSPDYVKKWM
jgi:hypothetical protein